MKNLSNFEMIQISGGADDVSAARKAGRAFGDFLGYIAAVAVYISDIAVDVVKTAS